MFSQLFASFVILLAFCHLLIFSPKLYFYKIISEIPSVVKTVWIRISPEKISGLIRIQSVLTIDGIQTESVSKLFQKLSLAGK